MKGDYLFVSDAWSEITGTKGGHDSDAMEKQLKARGLYPFGYLRGMRNGTPVRRPFYLAESVEQTKGRQPISDKDRIAFLEKQVADLAAQIKTQPAQEALKI